MFRPIALATFLLGAAVPQLEAADPAAPITATILPGWVQADGTRMAALHLELARGWKTYWRAPGDAGIPPVFDWSGSRNLGSVAVMWPTPHVFDDNGMRSIGYKGSVTIPLVIAPDAQDQPVSLRLGLDLGVCSDICMPFRLDLDAAISDDRTRPDPAIAAALAQMPYSAREAGVRAATCAFAPSPDGLQVEAQVTMPSAGGTEVMVIEPGQGDIWVSETRTRRNGDALTGVSELVPVRGGTIALDRTDIRLTVIGQRHAVEIRGCTAG
ncbi:protein-disulfide reductase DsbD domain-containing protein [Sulfitobacter sp. LCG007]